MQLGDMVTAVTLKLGDQNVFYPVPEVVNSGINPAQRLVCLYFPDLNLVRSVTTLNAGSQFIDLRTTISGHQFRSIRRIVVGDVSGQSGVLSSTTGELHELRRTMLASLMTRHTWLAQTGKVTQYFMWGRFFLGVYPRPVADTTLTLIYKAAPAVLNYYDGTASLTVPEAYHGMIAEIAAGLLLMKEGEPQTSRGLTRITQALGIQQPQQKATP